MVRTPKRKYFDVTLRGNLSCRCYEVTALISDPKFLQPAFKKQWLRNTQMQDVESNKTKYFFEAASQEVFGTRSPDVCFDSL